MILYLSRRLPDYDEICCAHACFDSENGHLTKNQNFAYSKWRTAGIWNIVIWLHLSEFLSGWRQIWYEKAESLTDTGHVIKITNFEN